MRRPRPEAAPSPETSDEASCAGAYHVSMCPVREAFCDRWALVAILDLIWLWSYMRTSYTALVVNILVVL